ncbi:unnamed protein product [Macrosiphum euphorbiae]|uniref:Retrotransposon gag domain-containing protein n=1 Tax=Macrosiphum euphorbiae TaxID=13131 RepID=A0AAV0W3J8_9HEMI|nr:unnamed protein product [Macrosiphum euphorbiae]
MSGAEEVDQSLTENPPLSLESLARLVSNMSDTFNSQLENISRKFSELDNRMDELCARIDDNDIDVRAKLTQVQSSVNTDLIAIHSDISQQQQRSQESQKSITITQRTLNDTVKALGDRISLVEGQSARLAALENKSQNSVPLIPPPTVSTNSQSIPQISFNSFLTSTTLASSCQTQTTASLNVSNLSAPMYNNPTIRHIDPLRNNTILSNISGITFDSTKLSPYDGKLVPLHPEEFLEQAEQYFLTQPPVHDQLKINYIKERFTGDARLWYNTLLPSPSVYQDFLLLFRNHFWSTNQQRAIRNELYRPYFHRDNSSLQKHAMDWINRARFLRPPIDQAEMVDQIISHFSFNISVALRGLRIVTTNELIQQLSHLQQAHSPQNTQNSQTASSHQNLNSQQNSFGHNNQNRYPPRQNNYSPRFNSYNRPQTDNTQNQSSPPSPDQATSPSGN